MLMSTQSCRRTSANKYRSCPRVPQGHRQEFIRYAWLGLDDLMPLTQDSKRAIYAHVLRAVRPLAAQLQRQRGQACLAEAALVAALRALPVQTAVEALTNAYGARTVLERVAEHGALDDAVRHSS